MSNISPVIITGLVHNTAPPVNTYPMQTRSKFGIVQHKIHPSLLLPSVKQALKDANWLAAMQQEYDALMQQIHEI